MLTYGVTYKDVENEYVVTNPTFDPELDNSMSVQVMKVTFHDDSSLSDDGGFGDVDNKSQELVTAL